MHVATTTNRIINVVSSDSDDDIVASSSGTSEQDFTPEHFYTAVILLVANQHANQISYALSRYSAMANTNTCKHYQYGCNT